MREREGVKAREAEDVLGCFRQADHTEGGDLGKVRLAYLRFGARRTEHRLASK